jgi:pyruvate kinase
MRGPEIRLGFLTDDAKDQGVPVSAGQFLTLVTDPGQRQAGTAQSIFVSFADLPAAVKPGQKIFVDDGALSLVVEESNANDGWIRTKAKFLCAFSSLSCVPIFSSFFVPSTVQILNNGKLMSNKGIVVPDANINMSALSEQDRDDLKFVIDNRTLMNS